MQHLTRFLSFFRFHLWESGLGVIEAAREARKDVLFLQELKDVGNALKELKR